MRGEKYLTQRPQRYAEIAEKTDSPRQRDV
jgi:hypothetical protein